ncbi:Detected protein of confused Function [Hibiscus syriacus]|uniref:Detected protein of confused Function n=1 Tax=Hibiscus syriacus TaxID=106335 RepID=A0A6A3C6W8_HIBSY|nr:Detected protein of confused Function [Hibiscus syriacus]
MKPSDASVLNAADIESDLEKLKKNILEAKLPSDPITEQAIEKLKQDVDKEVTRAFISMGLQEKLESLKLEPGAYLGLKQKLEKLSMVNRLVELKEKGEKLKTEINEKIPSEIKAKLEQLENAQANLSKGDALDEDLVAVAVEAKKELIEVLKSANLEIVGVAKRKVAHAAPELQEKIVSVQKEIVGEIERVVDLVGLHGKIEELKAEMAKDSSSPKVEQLQTEIKDGICAALDDTELKQKVENLRREFASSSEVEIDDKVTAENGRR